jgi:hypothetical protein
VNSGYYRKLKIEQHEPHNTPGWTHHEPHNTPRWTQQEPHNTPGWIQHEPHNTPGWTQVITEYYKLSSTNPTTYRDELSTNPTTHRVAFRLFGRVSNFGKWSCKTFIWDIHLTWLTKSKMMKNIQVNCTTKLWNQLSDKKRIHEEIY